MRAHTQGADRTLLFITLVLAVFGVLMVYSAGQTSAETGRAAAAAGLWRAQLQWLVVGLMAAYMVSRLSPRIIELMAWPAYAGAVILLLMTIIGFGSGAGTAASTTSWLTLFGKRVGQPSELAKIALVLMLAKVYASRKDAANSLLELWKPAIIVAIPSLIVLKQHDLGTALVFVGVFFGMLFWSGVKWQLLLFVASPAVSLVLAFNTKLWGIWFVLLTIVVIVHRPALVEGAALLLANVASGIAAELLWPRLNPFQQDRLRTFLDPTYDLKRAGYNVLQTKTAIGSGGWFGQGFNEGTQKSLSFIPEQPTDFIFAVLGEELGFVGVAVALGLFLALFLRTTRIASRANDSFTSLVAFGLTSIWLVHVMVNVGMNLSLVPVTGIPLPFFSYGGSFLLACLLCVGILYRISSEGRGRPDAMAL